MTLRMLREYVVAVDLQTKDDFVEIIPREQYIPGAYEPITDTSTKENAIRLEKEINDMGGAKAWLDYKFPQYASA